MTRTEKIVAGFVFKNEEFKSEYEDLKNGETIKFIQKVVKAVSVIHLLLIRTTLSCVEGLYLYKSLKRGNTDMRSKKFVNSVHQPRFSLLLHEELLRFRDNYNYTTKTLSFNQ